MSAGYRPFRRRFRIRSSTSSIAETIVGTYLMRVSRTDTAKGENLRITCNLAHFLAWVPRVVVSSNQEHTAGQVETKISANFVVRDGVLLALARHFKYPSARSSTAPPVRPV